MTEQTPLPLDSILVGKRSSYKITSLVGRGGFGVTYSATNVNPSNDMPERVAIKEFFPRDLCERAPGQSDLIITNPANIAMIGRLRERFIKESMNLAACDTPSVVKVFDTFETNGTAYVVMELVEGMTLKEYMKSRGNRPMPVDDARELILQAASALEYLHAQNINHLDIKPANMMVTPDLKQLVLIDFGLSRQYNSDGTTDSEIVAAVSKGYAAPEQYAGVKRFSPESDIYSLGATYFNLITGETPPEPFDISEDSSLLVFPADIPERDAETIKAAMEPDRAKRLGSVSDFIAMLTGRKARVQKGRRSRLIVADYILGILAGFGIYFTYMIMTKRPGDIAYEFSLGPDIYAVTKTGFAIVSLTGVAITLLAMIQRSGGQKLLMALIGAILIVSQIYYSM